MSMGAVTGESMIDIGVGRYGLRTFKPAIVRGEPYLVSVAQDAIPVVNPRFPVKAKWREFLTDSHPISWGDGTCKAVCTQSTTVMTWGGDPVWTDLTFHEPPDKGCGCGIYALDDLKDLYHEYPNYTASVVAVISASGRTIECQKGIRTQQARVVAYWVLDHLHICSCELCGRRRRTYIEPSRERYWLGRRADVFPYVECCETQFVNADRWGEPDEMAVHYGLKATPLPSSLRVTDRGRASGRVGVDLSPIINHQPGMRGYFEFEIPYNPR